MVQYMLTTDGPVCLEDVYLLTTDPVWPKDVYLLTMDGPVRASYRRSSLPQRGVLPDYGLSSLLERSGRFSLPRRHVLFITLTPAFPLFLKGMDR